MVPDKSKKIVAIFILACFIAYILLFQKSYSYSKRLDSIAVSRFRDKDMKYGLSLKEIHEPFSTKRTTVMVTPSEGIYREMMITYDRPNHFSANLARVLPRIYPFDKMAIRPDGMSVIDFVASNQHAIGIVGDEPLQTYLKANHFPPERVSKLGHICVLGMETPTLILSPSFQIPGTLPLKTASKMYTTYRPDWYDLKFPDRPFRIGTTSPLTSSHFILTKILDGLLNYRRLPMQKFMTIKPEIVIIPNRLEDIRQAFTDGTIDGYFIMTVHPSPIIQQLVVQESYQLLGLEGIDPTKYKMLFPYSEKTILNTSQYSSYSSVGIKSMQHPIHLVANMNISKQVIHAFIDSIFRNFIAIKDGMGLVDYTPSGQPADTNPRLKIEIPKDVTLSLLQIEFKMQMANFSPDYLYPRIAEFPLHPGAESYFREIGVITNNESPECGYTVGISSCDKPPHINPYRILI